MSDSVPYRDTADQWDALKDRAVVDRETVRNRMRHGWALEPALTTPKEWKRPVIARIRALVTGTPGITADALRAAMPDVAKPLIYRTVGRDVTAGRITTVKVAGGNPDGWAEVLGYVMVAEDARPTPKGRLAKEDQWQPAPWRNPIAAGTASKVQAAPLVMMDYSDPRRRAA
jgi:hypothetical protein